MSRGQVGLRQHLGGAVDGGQAIAQIVHDRFRNAANAGGRSYRGNSSRACRVVTVMVLNVDATAVRTPRQFLLVPYTRTGSGEAVGEPG